VPVTGRIDQNLLLQPKLLIKRKKLPKNLPAQVPKVKPRAFDEIPKSAEVLPPIPSNLSKETLNATELFQKVQSSVYTVITGSSVNGLKTGKDIFQGSAVAVLQKCLLTNCHLIENRPYILIIQGEKYVPVRLSGMQKKRDMCVSYVSVGGQEVLSKGYPGFVCFIPCPHLIIHIILRPIIKRRLPSGYATRFQ